MFFTSAHSPQVLITRIAARHLNARAASVLEQAASEAQRNNCLAVLVDLSHARRMSHCGLAALVEYFAAHGANLKIGFYGARPGLAKMFTKFGVSRNLPLYASSSEALQSAEFMAFGLAGTRAVILCAGKGTRMAPLSLETPKPMLDFLGRPVLEHIMGHLDRFGVRDIWLNPGHHGDQILSRFRNHRARRIQFSNEGQETPGGWVSQPLGSASTLARLHRENCAFDDDFIVLCGDALTDVNLLQMMSLHKLSGAEATLAAVTVPRARTGDYGIIQATQSGRVTGFQEKPAPEEAASRLASAGIYIFSPSVLQGFESGAGQDIATHLLPSLIAAGRHVQVYDEPFAWHDLGCGRDYVRGLETALRGGIPGVTIRGREQRPGVWVDAGAGISPRARVEGPVYIGRGSEVMAGAVLEGPCVIGANCRIGAGATVRRSVLSEGTEVAANTMVSGVIASSGWAIQTSLADGSPREAAQLPNLKRAGGTVASARLWPKLAGSWRT